MYHIISDCHFESDYAVNVPADDLPTCIGCLACWIKTPGRCVLKNDVSQEIIQSKHLVIISKSSFGSYSSKIKTVIDRSIPLILPTFIRVNGEFHHEARYETYPTLQVIAYDVPEGERTLMKKMVKAHSVNLHAPNYSVIFCPKEELAKTLSTVIGGLDV